MLLRVATAGSVDDGKSTLIGRLLLETGSVPEDQLEDARRATSAAARASGLEVDLSLLTDGLLDERAQGITIDVAWRHVRGERRALLIADCPGHQQYTRNFVTGASCCEVVVLLVDARAGLVQQTRRHALLASLLGLRHVVVAVNKMDLVGWDPAIFERVRAEFVEFATRLDVPDLAVIPVSARDGDNVVRRGERSPWYEGPTLLSQLEAVHVASDRNLVDLRLPVQLVLRGAGGGGARARPPPPGARPPPPPADARRL
jgi:bifunctional enzyme CysN/CysC